MTAVLTACAIPAGAQEVEAGADDHRGPALSVALGGGYSADVVGGGIARVGVLDVGWFVTRRLGLLAGLASATRGSDEWVAHSMLHVAAEYWVTPGWYLRIALGGTRAARLQPAEGWIRATEVTEDLGGGPGALVAAGHPLRAWRRLALNLQIAAGGALLSDDRRSSTTGFVAACIEVAIQ